MSTHTNKQSFYQEAENLRETAQVWIYILTEWESAGERGGKENVTVLFREPMQSSLFLNHTTE